MCERIHVYRYYFMCVYILKYRIHIALNYQYIYIINKQLIEC